MGRKCHVKLPQRGAARRRVLIGNNLDKSARLWCSEQARLSVEQALF